MSHKANKKERIVKCGITGAAAGIAAYEHRLRKNRRRSIPFTGAGHTVLITGASSGIGMEFARVFAERRFDLVLTARSEDKLNKLAIELRNRFTVQVTVIPADLSVESEARRLYEEVKSRGIEVEQLVNNAGAGKAGDVVDMDPDTMRDLIHLNVSSVTALCHYFGNDMKKAGRGKILNVSSLGAFIPDPHFNVYGPTKAYELFLTEAMSGELDGTGVTVSCLCPGPTRTNWAKNAGKADSKTALNPKDVARIGFEGMQAGELVIIPAVVFKAERYGVGMLPAKTQVRLIEKWQKKLITNGGV